MKIFWDGLTSMQKIMVVIIAMIIIWVLWNRFKGAYTAIENSVQAGGEIAQLSSQGIKATYTTAQYNSMADDLYEAMNGWGTDSNTIYATFKKLKNDVDFIKLDTAFGVREASDNLFGMLEEEDLQGWILDDLSKTQIDKLNKQLKNQGISKSF